jgi:hypothetical protein
LPAADAHILHRLQEQRCARDHGKLRPQPVDDLVGARLAYEYFNGDNGAGLGASHQTGWTALVAKLIEQSGE